MSTQEDLIFKGEHVLICLRLWSDIKCTLHSSHIGIDGSLWQARESVFLSGTSSNICEYIYTCETCHKFTTEQAKKTLMSHVILDCMAEGWYWPI